MALKGFFVAFSQPWKHTEKGKLGRSVEREINGVAFPNRNPLGDSLVRFCWVWRWAMVPWPLGAGAFPGLLLRILVEGIESLSP